MALITDQNTLFNSIQIAELNTVNKLQPIFKTYYKMQGYNPATQQYEDWHSENEPLMEPPSGNALLNISIIITWQDR